MSAATSVGRLWNDAACPPAWNMAADEILLRDWTADAGLGLRLYTWEPVADTIGYFQPYRDVAPQDRPWVRRQTGGGVVHHDYDLTVTVVAGRGHPFLAVDRFTSYRQLNDAIRLAFTDIGVTDLQLHAHDIPDSVDRAQLVCFETPAQYDVVGPRGKVAGGAQRRTALGLLHQGSIDLRAYPELRADHSALAQAVATRLGALFGVSWQSAEPDAAQRADIATLVTEKYGNDDWNHKR